MKFRLTACGMALGLFLGGALAAPAPVSAQGPDGRWPLQPSSGENRVIGPFLEGWYDNGDGTFTYSLGYSNYNDHVVELPLGEDNFIEPSQFDGMQPTTFQPGKHRGVFAITVPASMADVDVWWTLTNPNGEITKIPGRHVWSAYQLDFNPRPHGTLPPLVSFDDGNDETGRGPPGIMSQQVLRTSVGEPVTLAMHVRDVSINDPDDFRTRDGTDLRVEFSKYQGPIGGMVTFARHESTMMPESEDDDAAPRREPGPEIVPQIHDEGTAQVIATFDMPGEYIIRGQVDNFSRPDSSSGDQCCWSNGYIRVNVAE
ncbi:MAG: hypothetical protein PVJ80_05825 [Gemmatimonadota bacterium]